jgi:hypothetical protein
MASADKNTEAVTRIQNSLHNLQSKTKAPQAPTPDPTQIGDLYNQLVANALYRVMSEAAGEGKLPEGDLQHFERAAEALHHRHPEAFAIILANEMKS